jgi:adenosylmethionine-8-amino-7-oxononanoate aminotransferase
MAPTRRQYPDSPVFYRALTRDYPVAVRAEGCWIEDADGTRYLDAVGGAYVASIGHGVRAIGEAMARQAAQLAYVNGTAFTHEAVEGLAARLVARAPGLGKAYILGSGSEAVEAALKLARQHWAERGRSGKHRILAVSPGYHGSTLLALSASARAHYRARFGEWLVDVRRIPAAYPYGCDCGNAADCPACTGMALEAAILEDGAESVAAFIVEPVGGSSTGASVPRNGYLATVRAICDRYDVLLVADEVLCGAGRTGTWTACEAAGVVPDILVLGKGIAGGYAPVSAVLARDEVVEPIASGSGALLHAQTFSHHAVCCAAAIATLDYMAEHRLVERCAAIAPRFHAALATLRDLPGVGDVRGRGLLAGVEFVADTQTRTPFPRSTRVAERVTRAAQEAGLIVWPNVGQRADGDGDLVMLAPPYVITAQEIDEIVARLSVAVRAVLA